MVTKSFFFLDSQSNLHLSNIYNKKVLKIKIKIFWN